MNPTGSIPPIIFAPFLQAGTGRGQMVLYVRAIGSVNAIIPGIRAAILQVDPTLPQFEVHTLAQEMEAALVRERLIATLSTCFSALALVLACLGVYGLLAFAVAQRTGEIGIRMALGAARSDVLWMIMREAMGLGLLGVIVGVPVTIATGRISASRMSGLFFGINVADPLRIADAVAAVILVAMLAAFIPAWRASHIDPMAALRNE